MQDDALTTVTLEDLIRDGALPISLVTLAGRSPRVEVSWVHATEQVDPRPHLRARELVCTLGSNLVRTGNARSFVEALSTSGVAGVVLGLGEVHLEPPRELVESCEEFGVPLLLAPHEVPFQAVNEAVLRRRSAIESEARHQESALLSKLSVRARTGASVEALIEEASAAFAGELALVRSPRGGGEDVPAWAGTGPGPSQEFLDQLGSLLDLSRLEQARSSAEQQQRLGQLVDLVSRGLAHPAALSPELEAREMSGRPLQASAWPSGSETMLQQRWGRAIVGVVAHGVVMIALPEPDETFRQLGLVCGYGSVVDLAGIRRGLSEARSAFRLARNRGGIAGPSDLVSLEALLEQQTPETLAPFIEALISPLISADGEHRGDLVRTLKSFIAHDRQLQATADHLFVHVNTVRHRLARIRDITDRDPLTAQGLADLRIGLWAVERRRAIDHRLVRPLT